jgi:hypothetical protein
MRPKMITKDGSNCDERLLDTLQHSFTSKIKKETTGYSRYGKSLPNFN